jgi:hypothetical protein
MRQRLTDTFIRVNPSHSYHLWAILQNSMTLESSCLLVKPASLLVYAAIV